MPTPANASATYKGEIHDIVVALLSANEVPVVTTDLTATDVENALVELVARKGKNVNAGTLTSGAISLPVTELFRSYNIITDVAISNATLFDVTSLPGGVKNGDTLYIHIWNVSTGRFTIDSTVNTDINLLGNTTFTFENTGMYMFHWNSITSNWEIDEKHLTEQRVTILEDNAGQTVSAPALEAWGSNTPIGFIEEHIYVPGDFYGVRITSTVDCLLRFGNSITAKIEPADCIYFAAGTECFSVPNGGALLAVRTVGGSGTLSITALQGDHKHKYQANTVMPVKSSPSRIELPPGSKLRMFALTDTLIEFGDNTVTATDNSTLFTAGTEILNVPTGATYISAKRSNLDGGLYITGIL